jgi:hypothetical protein
MADATLRANVRRIGPKISGAVNVFSVKSARLTNNNGKKTLSFLVIPDAIHEMAIGIQMPAMRRQYLIECRTLSFVFSRCQYQYRNRKIDRLATGSNTA